MASLPFSLFGKGPVPSDMTGETTTTTMTLWLPPNVEPGGMQNDGSTPMTIFGPDGTKAVLQPGERCVWPASPKVE